MNITKLPVCVMTQKLELPRLDVYYPVVDGLDDYTVEAKINNMILTLVHALINVQGYYQNKQTEITGSYEIKTNERGILSLSIINYAYAGGAHGLTIIKSLTIDTETGKLYALEELFKPDADYIIKISDIIKEQIIAREITLLNDFEKIRANQDFYITDKCLVIYFQLYELTAYVYGFPYFPICVYKLQDIIKEDGPLGKMLY